MVELNYDETPVLPEDPDDDVRNEGHDDDEETEEPDRKGGEDDGVNSDEVHKYVIISQNENPPLSLVRFCTDTLV